MECRVMFNDFVIQIPSPEIKLFISMKTGFHNIFQDYGKTCDFLYHELNGYLQIRRQEDKSVCHYLGREHLGTSPCFARN